MEKICGFAVVKRPEFNMLYGFPAPKFGGIYYHGPYRCSWIDIYDPVYQEFNRIIPKHHKKLLDSLLDSGTTIVDTTDDLELAQEILRFVNEFEGMQNEIIVLYAERIDKSYVPSFEVDLEIAWLGMDISSGWSPSLLLDGIYYHSELFTDFSRYLNQYGLFDINSPIAKPYSEYYSELYKQGYDLEGPEIEGQADVTMIWVGVPKLTQA